MDFQRRTRQGAIVAALLGLAGAALTAAGDSPDSGVVLVFLGCTVLAVSLYWVASRYPSVVQPTPDLDSGSDQMVGESLYDLLAFCFTAFAVTYIWSETGFTSDAALTVVPSGLSDAFAALLPGVFLGVVVPALAEREVLFHWFEESHRKRLVGNSLRVIVLLVLLFALPTAVVGFLGTYAGGRIVLLAWWRVAG